MSRVTGIGGVTARGAFTLGDLNAHSPLWDIQGRSNCTGKNIEYILENCNLNILNEIEYPTYINNFTGRTCLDLCITTQNLSNNANCTRGRELGSDHFPIEVVLGASVTRSSLEENTRWLLKKADWNGWRKELEKNCDYQYLLPLDPHTHNKIITDRLIEISDLFIPKSRENQADREIYTMVG